MAVRRATCPKCGKAFGILDHQVGSDVFCPHCGQKMKTVAPKARTESVQDAAAAQMFGPAKGTPEPPQEATPRERASGEAVSAMESALGAPLPPPARSPARQAPVADAAPKPGADTRLAHHLGLDQQSDEHSALVSTPVRSKAVLWVWGTIIVLALAGITIAIVVQRSRLQTGTQRGTVVKRPRPQPTPGPHTTGPVRPEVGDDKSGAGDVRVLTPEELAAIPPPLTFHRLTKRSMYYENPAQREVLIGYLENYTDKVVRRAIFNIRALGGETKKVFGEDSQVFCDVKPGEKRYVVFDYPFVTERGTGFQFEVLEDETNEPEHEFEVTVRKIMGTGNRRGEVTCEVTNTSMVKARVVDVLLVFFDRQRRPSGYTRGQVVNLKPGENRQVDIPWKNWDREYVRIVEGRAQIGGQE